MIKSRQTISPVYFGGDMLTLFLSVLVSILFFSDGKYLKLEWLILAGFVLVWILLGYWRNIYDERLSRANIRMFYYIKLYFILLGLVLLFFSIYTFSETSKNVVIAFVISLPVIGIPVNFLLKNVSHASLLKSKPKYTLVAGVGNLAKNIERNLYKQQKSGYYIKGFVKCKKEQCIVAQDKIVGDLNNIDSYLKDNQVDEIVIAIPIKPSKKIKSILSAADYHGVRVKYIPDYQELLGDKYKITRYGQIEAVNVRQFPLDDTFAAFIKNCFDKVFSFLVLVLLSPLFLVLAVLIKLDSPGPIFYCPIRIGKRGRPFKVFKFRSMKENDSPNGGALSTAKNDQRITKLGKILRKYSLDELPQFMNVLLGDMSVVGPRPHRSFLNQQFQQSEDKYMLRHYFKPGITGWAQINGWRGPTETKEQKSQRTKHDLWYVENWSLWLDFKIVYLTIFGRNTHKSAF
ncbi:undecaprenyl-phosphate glucose phosphotransferase [Pontibacter sp. JH31]|uniref:Undecaprenyl-phosphate glucose phosphotransferase n=1 Tax=Pontibacter aquaedesilientis TaxID=2766980 RepID=A0ABR7XHJ1_9BACT|nr:undecaprenyl-phosphate glucose phosphotransferase [Pontibacter aquaedesilientis]MBD1397719.1 undecaprenyl-phosphate glucose phosphotransferase [Pontibacter aquaedesilientis]